MMVATTKANLMKPETQSKQLSIPIRRTIVSLMGTALISCCFLSGSPRASAALSATFAPNPALVGGKVTITYTLSGLGAAPGIFSNPIPVTTLFVSADVTTALTASRTTSSATPQT